MADFSSPYATVKGFGTFVSERSEHFGKRDALAALDKACGDCRNYDVRSQEIYEAINYLESRAIRTAAFGRLRAALDKPDSLEREQSFQTALRDVKTILGWK